MRQNKKRSVLWFLVISVLFLTSGVALGDTYPKGPVQLVIPFSPGGTTDILWRSISEFAGKNAKATLSLVNKTGGGGIVGTSFVVNSKPDGYTLVSANSDPLNIAPLFTPNTPYSADKDLTFICKIAVFPFTIALRADSPIKTLEELVAYAKANPGKLKAGVAGAGTTPHLIVEMFNKAAGIQITPVPFGGAGEVVPNLLGGHVDLTVISIPPIKSHFLSGKVRVLASFSPTRPKDFPQIPTIGEKGYKTANISTGVGLAGPKGLPESIVKHWEQAMDKTMKDPKVIDIMDKLDGPIVDFKTGEEYKKEILAELEGFKPIVASIKDKKK
ncbi:MAG: tripartite tricarboxylate transporter substrate binding protein [Syntrophorhabdaceae bacterium]|nr:tripartite tricarboxylate transporter substrate binding protein [Syntrophorhabdaceae bacterium]